MVDHFQLRPYQIESLDHAKARNTIVSLPTGYGKTLIAARLIDHYLKVQPGLKIAFLVPTRALVEQQAEYCTEHCRDAAGNRVVVQRLEGEDQAQWKQRTWDNAVRQCHVLLGTAALFQQAFVTDKYVGLERISLIIFDECHNAVGNSPMAAVMRDGVIPYVHSWARNGLPRILGLTASFVNGRLHNMEQKRKNLEALMISTIFCPVLDTKLRDETYESIQWDPDSNLGRHELAIAVHVDSTCGKVGPIKDVLKVIRRCMHVFMELGSASLFYYVDSVICQQIIDKTALLEQQHDSPETVRYARSMKKTIPALRTEMDSLSFRLRSDPQIMSGPLQTSKLRRLLELLSLIFHKKPDTHCGIVFVEQVALVSVLAKQINEFFGSMKHTKPPQCGAISGVGYQSQANRQAQLDAFSQGKARILVATAALEEGIDVSDCSFVIRFSSIKTTKAHIQGSGRARHPNAEIYYFENCPEVERKKEAAMLRTARNTSLSVSADEMQRSIVQMSKAIDKRHPYPQGRGATSSDDGIVNVFNCKQIFNTYCSVVLGKSISPKKQLYRFREEPYHPRKIISQVRFPTPRGWNVMREEDFQGFWEGLDLDQVFVSERTNKKTQSEKEEMAFIFVVVVELRMQGFLNVHNKPEKSSIFETKRACPIDSDQSKWGITITDKVVQSARY